MKQSSLRVVSILALVVAISCASTDEEHSLHVSAAEAARLATCEGFGPQAPRDIDDPRGTNPRIFSFAPGYERMNLCNIHFHKNAEHKGEAFSIPATDQYGGFRCAISEGLTAAEMRPADREICSGLKPGDTIEVHWVYSSCAVGPGKGLGACLDDRCTNPDLRVEAQVFTLVNDRTALDFTSFRYDREKRGAYHQAVSLPRDTGTPVRFLGSTTGPAYSNERCSPLQVSWSVRTDCAKLDIHSLGDWCRDNPFGEEHAHAVRELVGDPALLAVIE